MWFDNANQAEIFKVFTEMNSPGGWGLAVGGHGERRHDKQGHSQRREPTIECEKMTRQVLPGHPLARRKVR